MYKKASEYLQRAGIWGAGCGPKAGSRGSHLFPNAKEQQGTGTSFSFRKKVHHKRTRGNIFQQMPGSLQGHHLPRQSYASRGR